MTAPQPIAPGTRVRFTDAPIGVALSGDTGVVIGPDRWEGYVVVRLDAPATYHHADGREERVEAVREDPENLVVLPASAPDHARDVVHPAAPSRA